jgi:hypothetical protein
MVPSAAVATQLLTRKVPWREVVILAPLVIHTIPRKVIDHEAAAEADKLAWRQSSVEAFRRPDRVTDEPAALRDQHQHAQRREHDEHGIFEAR